MHGVDTDIFKPRSTRSALSLHAKLSGLSLSDTFKMGCWSNKTKEQRICKKPRLTFKERFQKAVANYEGYA